MVNSNQKTAELLKIAEKLKTVGLFESLDYSQIAKKVGISPKFTKRSIADLKRREIAHMSISMNYQKLPVIFTRVAIKSKKVQYNEEIFKLIRSTPYLDSATYLAGGEHSHIMSLVVPSLETLKEVLEKNAEKLSGMITNVNSMVVKEYLLIDNYKYTHKKVEKLVLDKKDWKILYSIREDATKSLTTISEEVGLQAPTIHRRIKALKKEGVINGYYCHKYVTKQPVNVAQVGSFFTVTYNGTEEEIRKLAQKIIENKKGWKTTMVLTFGDFDLSFNFWADSENDVREFIRGTLTENKNVQDIKIAMILDHYKGNFLKDFAGGNYEK